MPIPTDIAFTNCVSTTIGLHTSGAVDVQVLAIRDMMLAQGWRDDGKVYASVTLLNMTGFVYQAGAFDTIFLDYAGGIFQIFNPAHDPDPTVGNIVGVPVLDGWTQQQIMDSLVGKMNAWAYPPWFASSINRVTDPASPLYGTDIALFIEFQDPSRDNLGNGFGVLGNTAAGYASGTTKGGGWSLTSVPAQGNSSVTVEFVNVSTDNFLIRTRFNDSPARDCGDYYIQRRGSYTCVVNPYGWLLFAADAVPYTPQNVDEVNSGGAFYWLCCPRVPPELQYHPTNPITYCGFLVLDARDQLNGLAGATCINGVFAADFAFPDTGVALFPINAMYHAAGALTTTTLLPLTISSILGVSQGTGPLEIVGDVWDMYLVSQYAPLDAIAFAPNGKRVIAYRSQQAPCEATLWLALE